MRTIIAVVLAFLLTSCTMAKMELPDGTKVVYRDLHPGGNAVQAEGLWNDVASFKVNRETESTADTVSAVGEVVDAVSPL